MNILYISYENVFRTAIVQAMLLRPSALAASRFGHRFTILSSVKPGEADDVYRRNRRAWLEHGAHPNVRVVEIPKRVTKRYRPDALVRDASALLSAALRHARDADVIHCRGYGAGCVGLVVAALTRKPWVFDMRGVLPEELVHLGLVSRSGPKYRLLKRFERRMMSAASVVVTVSNRMTEYVRAAFRPKAVACIRNPADFARFPRSAPPSGGLVFLYSGSTLAWHEPERTVAHFAAIRRALPGSRMVFAAHDLDGVRELFDRHRVGPSAYDLISVGYDEMPDVCARCHVGICFRPNVFLSTVCAPVKFAEYAAAELFVLTNAGCGDLPELVREHGCGMSFPDLDDVEANVAAALPALREVARVASLGARPYNRDDLSFLDLGSKEGVDLLHSVYAKAVSGPVGR